MKKLVRNVLQPLFADVVAEENFTVTINRRYEFATNIKTYFDKCKQVINEFMLTGK